MQHLQRQNVCTAALLLHQRQEQILAFQINTQQTHQIINFHKFAPPIQPQTQQPT